MFGSHFYHQKVRKCVSIFGALFNNIYVIRKNSSGASVSQIKVPLSYAPKQKYLERIRENPDLDTDTKVAIKLPRTLDFEMKVSFYGAINTGEIIRNSIVDLYLQNVGLSDSDVANERINTVPDPLSTIGLADSDYGFTTTITSLT
jgi:hypothetical protein